MLTLEKIQKALQHVKEVTRLLKDHLNQTKIIELIILIEASLKDLEKEDPDLSNMDPKTLENIEKAIEITEAYYFKYAAN